MSQVGAGPDKPLSEGWGEGATSTEAAEPRRRSLVVRHLEHGSRRRMPRLAYDPAAREHRRGPPRRARPPGSGRFAHLPRFGRQMPPQLQSCKGRPLTQGRDAAHGRCAVPMGGPETGKEW